MVAIVIFTDKGEAYCMSNSPGAVVDCVKAVTSRDDMQIKYIGDTEKRLKYISRAVDSIEGA